MQRCRRQPRMLKHLPFITLRLLRHRLLCIRVIPPTRMLSRLLTPILTITAAIAIQATLPTIHTTAVTIQESRSVLAITGEMVTMTVTTVMVIMVAVTTAAAGITEGDTTAGEATMAAEVAATTAAEDITAAEVGDITAVGRAMAAGVAVTRWPLLAGAGKDGF